MVSLHYLREAHANGNLIPFLGAGTSRAAANLPTWPELLARGIDFTRSARPPLLSASNEALTALSRQAEAALADGAQPGLLLQAFAYLQEVLGANGDRYYESLGYQAFLTSVFHEPEVQSETLLEALRSLDPRICVTTNYDTLLEEFVFPPVAGSTTWLQPNEVGGLLRTGSGVFHLHGRYDASESVVLSSRDYDRIVAPSDAATLSHALFHSGVLLFIGTSLDGLTDPHLRQLLDEFSRISGSKALETSPHVMLVRGKLSDVERVRLRSMGIDPLTFGGQFEDLPDFMRSIRSPESITIAAEPVVEVTDVAARAKSRQEVMRSVESFIRDYIYRDRQIRITYAELTGASLLGRHLEAKYVQPPNATHNVFNYPLSIAAWALIEGRIIAWPDCAAQLCDLDLVDRLGRLEEVERLLSSPGIETEPELRRYVDIDTIRAKFGEGTLTLQDFFQDWAANQAVTRYGRFISVPVPVVQSFGNRQRIPQLGVFNIDTREARPLLDDRSRVLLRLASSLAALAYQTP